MTTNDSAIVYVHGISDHQPGYSDAWHAALKPHLSRSIDKHEVRWSDIVNALSMAIDAASEALAEGREVKFETGDDTEGDAKLLVEQEDLRDEIEAELASRAVQNRQANRKMAEHSGKLICGESGFGLTFDDFVRYMIWEDTRNEIVTRFNEVVIPLLRDGRTLNIIAHSWGTVVAYEALRRLDDETFSGRGSNLIVLGSPLSIGPVQRNLFGRIGGGSRPKLVDNFVNVDAGGDIVGGPLAPTFNVTEQFLRQRPTGCSTFFLWRRVAKNFVCAHSSYFNQDNVAVNRDIIARYINKASPRN